MKIRRKILALAVITIASLASACPQRTSIADIVSRPGKYENKEVSVAGVVKDAYGLSIPGTKLGGGIYKIDDGTGAIWVVVSEGSVPAKGSEIGVRGRISTGVNWSGRNYGLGMHEDERRYKKH